MTKFRFPLAQYLEMLNQYLRPQWVKLSILLLLLLTSIGAQLVNPQIIRYFIDAATTQSDLMNLWYAAALFIGVSVSHQAIVVAATYIGENVGWIATNQLRSKLASHCLKLDMTFHRNYSSGTLIERVDGDINALSNFFSSFVVVLLSNIFLIIGIITMLAIEGWQVGLTMILFVVFALWVIQFVRKFAIPYIAKTRAISAEFYGFIGEHLEGTEDTRANGASQFVMNRFYSINRRWLPAQLRSFLGFASVWATSVVVFAIGMGAAFAFSSFMWGKGSISIGTVFIIVYYTELLASPIENIRMQLQDLQRAEASIGRVKELLEIESQIQDGTESLRQEGPLSIRFDHVDFGYEDHLTTLQDIHFELKAGKSLGILGRTGSGKSTLSRLLLRFYDTRSGTIFIDHQDIRQLKLQDLRKRVGFVTQQIELFQGTIRDNLTFYDDSIMDEQIIAILDDIELGDWLSGQPNGLDTMLESNGNGLSAGEAQLLAFARVFLTNPGIVILDEASSRLDPATEHKIESAIDKLLSGRTCIIIAHRLATIERVDQLLILEDGHIVEQGERTQLIADPQSRFTQMRRVGMEEVAV
ncbi:ABC transporter ATP-binding protein [Paenibacillus albiflavus]|uniref:ABC transporter ATP-binding protein n=1 Tax=Paenibacillus albiflavus TaxID=2545760 RepID=A0A4R4EMA3_9BACL|nr:ABC transporter ATP-binding protein [Paenibacillus albiflavus]TCZ79458.1 ABC transporter ATP-binding protein [Paenibacillus albiflavus]